MAADKYLAIYVNDHLAALTAVRDVARRSSRSNRGTDLGAYLEGVAGELETARTTLRRIMRRLGIRRDPLKALAGWAAEKLGRLKLNGHLVTYSPLSRVLELEGLVLAAEIELRTWEALGPRAGEDLSALKDACIRRREELARHHVAAARAALGGEPSSPTR